MAAESTVESYVQHVELCAEFIVPAVNNMLDTVRIMVDDSALRENRIALLRMALKTINRVGDLTKLQMHKVDKTRSDQANTD